MQKLTLAYYKYPSQTVRNPTSQSSSFFNTHSYTQKTTSSQFSKLKCQTQQQQQNPLFFLFFLFTHCTSSSYVPGSPPPQPKQPPTTWWISEPNPTARRMPRRRSLARGTKLVVHPNPLASTCRKGGS